MRPIPHLPAPVCALFLNTKGLFFQPGHGEEEPEREVNPSKGTDEMKSFIIRSAWLAALLCLIPALAGAANGHSVPPYLQNKVTAVCQQAAAKGLMTPVAQEVDRNTLLVLLTAPCNQVRCVAVYTLGDIRETRAVEPLIALLSHEDPTIRRMAAHALGKIKDPRAVYPLAYLLNNPNERVMVRCAAASAIGRISCDRASRILLASYPRTRGRVHNVIGTMLSSR